MSGLRLSPVGIRPRAALAAIGAQGLSSLSNFGVQVGLAMTLAPARFGALVVGFAVYYLALAMVRALVGDPLVALSPSYELGTGSDQRGEVLWRALRRRIGVIAGIAAVLVAGLGAVLGTVRVELSVLALAMPGLLMQDGFRARCFARSKPGLVVLLDGAWIVVSGLAIGATMLIAGPGSISGSSMLVAWAVGGLFSAVLGWRLRPRLGDVAAAAATATATAAAASGSVSLDPDLSVEEQATTRSLGRSQAVLALDANGLPAVVAAVAGATTSGGMRAAALPFMPVVTVVGALRLLTLPMLRRSIIDDRVGRTAARVTAVTTAVAAGLVGLILVLLSVVPDGLLGPTGQYVRPWFLAAGVVVSARMVAMPLSDVLSLGVDQRRVLRFRLGTTVLDWTATLTGALVGGLSGAMQARTATALFAVVVWACAAAEAVRRSDAGPPTSRSEESEPYLVA